MDFDVTSGNGSSVSTQLDAITLTGNSPYNAFTIRAVDHPEARWEFENETTWTLSGIELAQGLNNIQVEALDENGVVVGSETFRVNKTGDARPRMLIDAKPGSYHVALQDSLELDASGECGSGGNATGI